MESNSIDAMSQKGLMQELIEGRELTKQLCSILLLLKEKSSSSSPNDESNNLDVITQKILSKIERSLTILRNEPTMLQLATSDSPPSFHGSPKSPDSDGDSKDPIDCKDESKKRKVIPRCTMKVEGCCKSGLEGPVEDGFGWRKYGQKDILGAKYPRAYYRCTQRGQGCFATKQVQRNDDDPTYFEVSYRGNHTCSQASSSSSSSMPNLLPKPEPSDALPCSQPQQIIWSFDTEPINIKPLVSPNKTHIKPPSFPPHFGATQHNSTNNNNHDNNSLFCPGILDNNSNNYQISNNNNNNPKQGDVEALDIATKFSFDLELLDHDFIFDSPHFFH